MLRVFFDACHRHDWLPGLPSGATIHVEELPFHHQQLPRFIPEYIMAQLESDRALAKLPHTSTRHLIIMLIETGIRGGDACNLPFNPIIEDSSGWACLRFEAVKMRAEQLIPLSANAAAIIRAQQDHVRTSWPTGSRWLFPGIADNDHGAKPYSHSSLTRQIRKWCADTALHDEAGRPVQITGHQFRHTLVISRALDRVRHVSYVGCRVRASRVSRTCRGRQLPSPRGRVDQRVPGRAGDLADRRRRVVGGTRR